MSQTPNPVLKKLGLADNDRVAIIHDGKLVMDEAMADVRSGSDSLEETFVRVVGAGRTSETLDWL